MATIQQIKNGVARYVDDELLPHLSGAKRFGAAVYTTLVIDGIDSRISEIMSIPAVKILGLMDGDNIDIDKLHAVASARMGKEDHIDVDTPVGRFTFRKQDIDKIYDIINKS